MATMTKIPHWFASVGLALLLALSACGGGGGGEGGGGGVVEPPPPPTIDGNFFPLAVGDRWVYAIDGAAYTMLKASVTQTVDGQTGVAVVAQQINGFMSDVAVYVVSATGVREYPGGATDPVLRAIGPVDVMRLPLHAGDRFEQTNKTIALDFDGDGRADTAAVRSQVEVVGRESVTTPLGTFDASVHLRTTIAMEIALTSKTQTVPGTITLDDWYASDIGRVRNVMSMTIQGNTATQVTELTGWRVGSRRSETVAPSVQSATPADGSVRGLGVEVHVTFSEVVAIASAEPAITVRDAAGKAVLGYASVDRLGERELTFRPQTPFTDGRYTVQITPGVEDLLGNAQAAASNWSFTIDGAGPVIASSTPPSGAVDVVPGSAVVVRFDEPIDPATVTSSRFTLEGATLRLAVDGATVTATPTAPLARLRDYTLVIAPGVKDMLGNASTEAMFVRFTTDAGRFALPANLPGSTGSNSLPNAVAVGDVNGDGRADVVATASPAPPAFTGYRLLVYLQQPDGTLTMPLERPMSSSCCASSLAIGDVDGDGRNDVVVATSGSGIQIFRQTAAGTLEVGALLPSAQDAKVRLVDFNGDGRLDMVAIGASDSIARVWRQSVGGVMTEQATPAVATSLFPDLDVGDINGDGLPDIVVGGGNSIDNTVVVLLQRPGLSFAPPLPLGTDGRGVLGVAVGDFNGDGRKDLVVAVPSNSPAYVGVYLQQVDGSLGPVSWLPSYDIPAQVEAADINGDGRTDIVVGHAGWNAVGVYLQQPDGTLAAETRYPAPASGHNQDTLAVGDINGDGRPDVVCPDGVLLQRQVDRYAQRWTITDMVKATMTR